MTRALSVAQVIAGEATSGTDEQRIADMRAIASVIANRAALLGVTQDSIIAAPTENGYEFNAYNARLPPGVDDDIVAMAQEAIDYVAENGPVNNATFYATPAAVDNLPGALSFETATDGHQFFSDPLGRAIGTSEGYVTPNQFAYAANPANVPTPEMQSASTNQWSEMVAASPVQAMQPSPGWGLNKDVAPALTPTVEGWSDMASAKPVQAPMDSVTARGFLGAPSSLQASAVATPGARPSMNVAAAGLLGANPALSANAAVRGLPDVASVESRMGIAEPGFDQGRFGDPIQAGLLNAPSNNHPISQADINRALFNATGASEMDPGFVAGLMGPQTSVVPSAVQTTSVIPGADAIASADTSGFDTSRFGPDVASFDQGRFGQTEVAEFDQSRFGPSLVDPGTNTAGFLDQPGTPADIAGFSDAMAAQRGAPTGLNSAESQAMRGHVEYAAQQARQDQQLNSFPSLNVPATAQIGAVPGLTAQAVANVPTQTAGLLNNPAMATPNFTQAMNPAVPALASTPVEPSQYQMQEINKAAQIPGVIAAGQVPAQVSAYVDDVQTSPAVAAIEAQTNVPVTTTSSALLSPTSIASMNPTLTPAFSKGILPSQPINQVGFLNGLPADIDINLSGNIVPAAPADFVTAPSLETIEVEDQPEVATVPGPATTDAVDQQETQTTAKAPTTVARTTPAVAKAQPSFVNSVKGLLNPGTSIGATIGGFLGLPGAAIGGLLGNGLYQGLQSESQPMSINNIGSGYDNVTSIWSGGQPPGTQATASDGQTVTAMPGGMVAITNSSGVTTTFDKNGKASSYFGNDLDQDQDTEASTSSGGFFGGLFG